MEANTFPIPAVNQVPMINDSLIFNLATGTHSIYITDDNNCEGAVTFGTGTLGFQRDINALQDIPSPDFVISASTCYNTNDGTAQVLLPDSLFTYTWESDIFGNPSGLDVSNGSGTYFGAFSPGDYWLVTHYSDSSSFGIPYYGCDVSVSFTILPGSTPIIDGGTITNVSCYSFNDGEISLNISGGTLPYDLYWDSTSVYPNGLATSNPTLTNLTSGTYALTITDAQGCIYTQDYEVAENDPLISDIIPTHVSCFGLSDGQAIVTVATGSGTYAYLWDSNPAQTTNTAIGLSAGNYICTITDLNDCTYNDTIVILQPTASVALVEVDSLYFGNFDVSCFGASDASAIATGSGVSFVWTDALGNIVSTDQHTATILSAGEYTVTSTDINGCDGSGLIEITEPTLLSIFVTESNPSSTYQVSCFGAADGWAEVIIQGGVENNNVFGYDIFWSNNLGNPIIGDTIADNLSAGFSYMVNVNDANGCEDVETSILYTEPIEFIADVTTINYAGPFHAPKNISFIDSTISVESYGFEWIWQDGLQEYLNGVNQIDNQVFIHEFLKDELDTNYVFVMLTNEVTGCQDSVEFIIEVQGIPEVNNVFTPNQDGINDNFSFSEYAMELVDVQIFNRWGQLVYTWVGSDKSWKGIGIDGKDLPEGVYFYVFEGKGVDGHYYDKKGSVNLLR